MYFSMPVPLFCSSYLHTGLHLSTVAFCFMYTLLSLDPTAVVSDPAGDDACGSGAHSAYVHPINQPDSWWPGQHAGQRRLICLTSSLTPRHWLRRNHTVPDQLNQRDPYHTTINTHTWHHFYYHAQTYATPTRPTALTALDAAFVSSWLQLFKIDHTVAEM